MENDMFPFGDRLLQYSDLFDTINIFIQFSLSKIPTRDLQIDFLDRLASSIKNEKIKTTAEIPLFNRCSGCGNSINLAYCNHCKTLYCEINCVADHQHN